MPIQRSIMGETCSNRIVAPQFGKALGRFDMLCVLETGFPAEVIWNRPGIAEVHMLLFAAVLASRHEGSIAPFRSRFRCWS